MLGAIVLLAGCRGGAATLPPPGTGSYQTPNKYYQPPAGAPAYTPPTYGTAATCDGGLTLRNAAGKPLFPGGKVGPWSVRASCAGSSFTVEVSKGDGAWRDLFAGPFRPCTTLRGTAIKAYTGVDYKTVVGPADQSRVDGCGGATHDFYALFVTQSACRRLCIEREAAGGGFVTECTGPIVACVCLR
jgi:hypothetical protein